MLNQNDFHRMKMIKVKQSCMVSPAEDTPRQILWLSSVDLIRRPPNTHTPTVFIYRPKDVNKTTTAADAPNSSNFFEFATLKEALSRALVHFYPLAGRLKRNEKSGRLEIDCNREGVLFIEAEIGCLLADFGEYFTPNAEFRRVVIPSCDYSGGLASYPLLIVQLTRFSCGGRSLGFALNHQVADGAAFIHFVTSWARLAKGLELSVLPYIDRSTHLAPRQPPQVKFRHFEYEPPLPPKGLPGDSRKLSELIETATTVSVVKFSKEQLHAFKLKASSGGGNTKLSTYEILATHVWQCVCKARGLADDEDVRVDILSDGRLRLDLPQGYFGNAIFTTSCIAKAGDVAGKPFCYVANMVHEAIRRIRDEEYLRSAIDYLESEADLTATVRGVSSLVCPNLLINSWVKLPAYEADFGWGAPAFFGPGGLLSDGYALILQSPEIDGSLLVTTKLFTHHMAPFLNYLFNFSTSSL